MSAQNETEEELLNQCYSNFYLAATVQGRLAFCLMSFHAVNPSLYASFSDKDPTHFLFSNMLYGMAVHFFSRPSLTLVGFFHRLTFSVLGSMMFNYSSMRAWEWVAEVFAHRPALRTFTGFFLGRIFMVHLLAYLYHNDSRCMGVGNKVRRNSAYETMYA